MAQIRCLLCPLVDLCLIRPFQEARYGRRSESVGKMLPSWLGADPQTPLARYAQTYIRI